MDDACDKASRINPGEVRYIKLGAGGAWERAALDGGRLDWGSPPVAFEYAASADWEVADELRLGSERLTGALLDRLTHHVSILTMNGDSYRLKQSAGRRRPAAGAEQNQAIAEIVDSDTGEIITT